MIDQMDLGSVVRIITTNGIYEGELASKQRVSENEMWTGCVELISKLEDLDVHYFINFSHVVAFHTVKEAESDNE